MRCGPGAKQSLVVELTKEESAKAAELYRKLTAAQADWESFRQSIRDKYGPALYNLAPATQRLEGISKADGTLVLMPVTWAAGIDFSHDFRFAVPKKQ